MSHGTSLVDEPATAQIGLMCTAPDATITVDFMTEPWAPRVRRSDGRSATSPGDATNSTQIGPSPLTRSTLSTPRQIARGAGVAVLIAVATALASHLIGTGRGVPAALIDVLRLGPRGTIVVELGYYIAAGVAAAAAVATFTLLTKRAGDQQRVRRGVRIAVAAATMVVCFVAPDFAIGGSPIGAYTSHGAYEFVSAPGLHPPIVRADVTQPGQLAKGYIFIGNFYNPSDPPLVGQSGPLILDQRLSPVWFKPVPEDDLATNLSLQTYEGRPVLAWWQGQNITDNVPASQEYVVVDQHYRPVAVLRGADGWVLTLHDFVIRGQNAWVTASKNVHVNLSRYGGAHNGAVIDSAVQEYNLKNGKLIRSWDALDHIPLSDSWRLLSTHTPWDAFHLNSIELPGDGSFVVSMRNTWAAYKVNIATGRIEWTLGGKHSSFKLAPGAGFQWQHDVMVYPGTPFVTLFDDAAAKSQPRAGTCRVVLRGASCSSSTWRRTPQPPPTSTPRGLASTPSSWATWNHSPAATSWSVGARSRVSPSTPPRAGCCSTRCCRVGTSPIARLSSRGSGCRCIRQAARHDSAGGRPPSMRAGTVQRKWSRGGCSQDRPATTSRLRPRHRKSASKPRSRYPRRIAPSGCRLLMRVAG